MLLLQLNEKLQKGENSAGRKNHTKEIKYEIKQKKDCEKRLRNGRRGTCTLLRRNMEICAFTGQQKSARPLRPGRPVDDTGAQADQSRRLADSWLSPKAPRRHTLLTAISAYFHPDNWPYRRFVCPILNFYVNVASVCGNQ